MFERGEDSSAMELLLEVVVTCVSLVFNSGNENICFEPPRGFMLGWNAGWTIVDINESAVVPELREL